MNSSTTQRFVARRSEFDAIHGFVTSACAGIEEEERQRALLLVEELFANTVLHGYGGDSDQAVWLTVRIDEDGCRLIYEDGAPQYNPFLAEEPDLDSAVPEDRPVGGLGIVLLNELSSSRNYARDKDRNVIELQVRRNAGR